VLGATAAGLALALFISWQAAEAERQIVRAVKMSLALSRQPDPRAPRWESLRQDLLQSVRHGIEINPHYRKITPMVADELAQIGDWDNARWIWESVVASRPYVVAIQTNIARAYAHKGDLAQARAALEKARAVQPAAPAVLSMHLLLMAQAGEETRAAGVARALLRDIARPGIELLNTAYTLGTRSRDWPLALLALERRIEVVPSQAAEAWLRIGHIHADPAAAPDEVKALAAYRAALQAAPETRRPALLRQIPPSLRERM
jgi:O-antigen ligase